MVRVSLLTVYSQPIICKAAAGLLRTHFLPTLDKIRKKTVKVRPPHEELGFSLDLSLKMRVSGTRRTRTADWL